MSIQPGRWGLSEQVHEVRVRLWHVRMPATRLGAPQNVEDKIGTLQTLQKRYPAIIDHVYLQVKIGDTPVGSTTLIPRGDMKWKSWTTMVLFWGLVSCAAIDVFDTERCNSPHLIEGYLTYNELVCSADEQMKEGRYQEAVETLTTVTNMELHEVANHRLLSTLAIAHLRSGDAALAEQILMKSELSLMAYAGIVQCSDFDLGSKLTGRGVGLFEESLRKEVATMFCSEALRESFARDEVHVIEGEYLLFREYQQAREIIEGE